MVQTAEKRLVTEASLEDFLAEFKETEVVETVKAVGDSRYNRSSPASIMDLGNSIASAGVLSYYDRVASGTISFSQLSYMGWAMGKVGGKFYCKGVAAQGSYTMEQIISTWLTPAIAAAPDYMHLQVFTNNINPIVLGTITLDAAKALYMQIVDACVDAGIIPIIATVPPVTTWNTGIPLTVFTKVNLWLKDLAEERGFPLVDYHSVLVNPADNNMIAAYTSDGVHMTAAGAKVMGEALAAVLSKLNVSPRSPLWASYNPNFILPDVVFTSALSDKWYVTGSTSGGWAYKIAEGSKWKGKSWIATRGSAGDFNQWGPMPGAWAVAGNRIRVVFGFDASLVPASGTWSAYIYNATQFQAVCGFTAMPSAYTEKSMTTLTGTTTNGSPIISAAAGTFKPEHIGCAVSSVNPSGLLQGIPINTNIRAVSEDGTQAYLVSADTGLPVNATQTVAGTAYITVSGPQCIGVFEFTVQPDMVGDTLVFAAVVAGATGTTLQMSQVTIYDITALGVEAA